MRTDEVRLERREVDLDRRGRSTARDRRRPRGRCAGAPRTGRRGRRSPPARSPSGTSRCSGRRRTASTSRRSPRPCCRSSPCRSPRSSSAPGPKYSTIAPVPPFTVRMPATVEDDVLRRGPARERAGEPHADQLRDARVVRPARHHVDRVGAADADRDHAEPARVRRVRVGADHHAAGERVVLEHDLVDDPAARLPEADAVLRRHACAGTRRPRGSCRARPPCRRRRRCAPGSGGRSAPSSAPRRPAAPRA